MTSWQTMGFDKIKDFFIDLEERGSLGHAYLFSGQDMIGKKTMALELAGKFNGIKKGLELNHPDIFFISSGNEGEKKSIQIEDVRELKKFAALKAHSGPYRYVIIDNAHDMTNEAANSLLKLLEEPPKDMIIFLISSFYKKILPTVISRCEKINFFPHKKEELEEYIKNLGLNSEQASFLANFSNGRIGLAINLHKNNSFSDMKKTIGHLKKLINGSIKERFDVIEKVTSNKNSNDAEKTLLIWMLYLRSPLASNLGENKKNIMRKMLKVYNYIKQPHLNHRLLFEQAFVGN